MADSYCPPESRSQAGRSFGATSTCATHVAAAGDGWYQLFFQFEGIAEAWLQRDNWALFREILRGNGDIDRYISDLSRPDALEASLNWYRANLAPRLPASPPKLPAVKAPTLGIWSSNDHYLDGERMKMSGQFVKGPWRYEQIDHVSHWIPLDARDQLNQLLVEWLG